MPALALLLQTVAQSMGASSLQFFKKPVRIWWLRPSKYPHKLFQALETHYLMNFKPQSRKSSFKLLVGVAYVDVMEFTCSMHNVTTPGTNSVLAG